MAKKLFSILATVALASTLLAGCGASPNGVTAGIKSAQTAETVEGKDYYTVSRAKRIAQDGLARYNDLRDDWMRAYSDREKDRIEDQMLVVLSGTIGDVRDAVSAEAGANGYNSRQVFDAADRAIARYEDLRYQWSNTSNINRQREIANEMQTVIVDALNRVLRVRS